MADKNLYLIAVFLMVYSAVNGCHLQLKHLLRPADLFTDEAQLSLVL
jgi:hypothetical protein